MKNFIEIATRDGNETINVNHVFRVSPYQGRQDDPDKCLIYFAVSNSKVNGGVASMYTTENYEEIIAKIENAI